MTGDGLPYSERRRRSRGRHTFYGSRSREATADTTARHVRGTSARRPVRPALPAQNPKLIQNRL